MTQPSAPATPLEGVDLSERLLVQFGGEATLYVAVGRKIPFEDFRRIQKALTGQY